MSRGYSFSQPSPSASAVTLRWAQARNLAPRCPGGQLSSHARSPRSSTEPVPLRASRRTACRISAALILAIFSSPRHCTAYCNSSLGCRVSGVRSARSRSPAGSSSCQAMKAARSGRPRPLHRRSWTWHKTELGCAHSSHEPIRHVACPTGMAIGGSAAAHRPGPGQAARCQALRCRGHSPPLATPKPQPTAAQAASGACPCHGFPGEAANISMPGRPASAHRSQCPVHMPRERADRPHPATRHAGPPKTGSPGANTSTSPRNSGRIAAISAASRPGCGPGT